MPLCRSASPLETCTARIRTISTNTLIIVSPALLTFL
jgi:hypothetical protein